MDLFRPRPRRLRPDRDGYLFWLESRRQKHAKLGLSGVPIVEGLTIGSVTGIAHCYGSPSSSSTACCRWARRARPGSGGARDLDFLSRLARDLRPCLATAGACLDRTVRTLGRPGHRRGLAQLDHHRRPSFPRSLSSPLWPIAGMDLLMLVGRGHRPLSQRPRAAGRRGGSAQGAECLRRRRAACCLRCAYAGFLRRWLISQGRHWHHLGGGRDCPRRASRGWRGAAGGCCLRRSLLVRVRDGASSARCCGPLSSLSARSHATPPFVAGALAVSDGASPSRSRLRSAPSCVLFS